MRLIDADELMKHAGNCYDEQGHLLYAVGTGNIMAAKTIDPVKHGKWIEDAKTYYEQFDKRGMLDENTPYLVDDIACSVCLAKYSVIDNETERFEYCPECGAKMNKKEE